MGRNWRKQRYGSCDQDLCEKKNLLSKNGRKKDFVSFKSECFSSKRQMVTDFGENVDKDKPMILG